MDCERCKRPRKRQGMGAELPPDDPYEHCVTTGDAVCQIAAASYKRGVRDGKDRMWSGVMEQGGYVCDLNRRKVDGWMREHVDSERREG